MTREEAVSPVLGVLLLVAITIILAAIIAAFIFGMVGQVERTKNIAVTGERVDGDTARITVMGGIDMDRLDKLVIRLYQAGTELPIHECDANPVSWYIGYTKECTDDAGLEYDRVIVTAVFTDQSEQVVLDQDF